MTSVLASRDLLAAIIQSADDAIYTIGLEGSITSWNNGAMDLFGYRSAQIVGAAADVLMPENRSEETKTRYAEALQGRQGTPFETDMRTSDGRVIAVSLRVSPLRDGSGDVVGICTIARDPFAGKATDDLLREHSEELERSNAELDQFAHTISHDLQEPLRTMKGFAHLIERDAGGRLDDQTAGLLDRIIKAADRMQELVNDLLKYASVGADQIRFEQVECEDVLLAALADLDAAISESGTVVTHDPLPAVKGDRVLLIELFENLIGNAMKFRGSKKPFIHVGVERESEKWRFSIRDNGIGMDPRFAKRIFQPLRRLHTREEYSGSGMGLAICRKIVERHGGTIWTESEPRAGATFYFTLSRELNAPLIRLS